MLFLFFSYSSRSLSAFVLYSPCSFNNFIFSSFSFCFSNSIDFSLSSSSFLSLSSSNSFYRSSSSNLSRSSSILFFSLKLPPLWKCSANSGYQQWLCIFARQRACLSRFISARFCLIKLYRCPTLHGVLHETVAETQFLSYWIVKAALI